MQGTAPVAAIQWHNWCWGRAHWLSSWQRHATESETAVS